MPSGTLYHVTVVGTDILENILPPSLGFLRVTQLWTPITLRNLEDGGDMFSETSVLTRATWYRVPEGIYNHT
jgi:hypothetical protein